MRIDSIAEISQVYQANGKMKKVESTSKMAKDSVSISSFGRDLQVAKDAIKNTPDVREDKVNEVRTAINNGTYNVPMSALADKLLAQSEAAMKLQG